MEDYFPPPHEHAKSFHQNGKRKTFKAFLNGKPSPGWSAAEWDAVGHLIKKEYYGNNQLLEWILFDANGRKLEHQVWNNRQKKFVDKLSFSPPGKHNTLSGADHMGTYMEMLPAVAAHLEAMFDKEGLWNFYESFMDNDAIESAWKMKGNKGLFSIIFEKGEMLYFWNCTLPNEKSYAECRKFLEDIGLLR